MQLEAKSILQVLGRWSRRPDFSRLRQLRHADTTLDSLRILDLQIYSLNWLSYGPRAWPLFNQMPPPPPNKSQTSVRTHSYHLITLILHRSLSFFFFFFFKYVKKRCEPSSKLRPPLPSADRSHLRLRGRNFISRCRHANNEYSNKFKISLCIRYLKMPKKCAKLRTF